MKKPFGTSPLSSTPSPSSLRHARRLSALRLPKAWPLPTLILAAKAARSVRADPLDRASRSVSRARSPSPSPSTCALDKTPTNADFATGKQAGESASALVSLATCETSVGHTTLSAGLTATSVVDQTVPYVGSPSTSVVGTVQPPETLTDLPAGQVHPARPLQVTAIQPDSVEMAGPPSLPPSPVANAALVHSY